MESSKIIQRLSPIESLVFRNIKKHNHYEKLKTVNVKCDCMLCTWDALKIHSPPLFPPSMHNLQLPVSQDKHTSANLDSQLQEQERIITISYTLASEASQRSKEVAGIAQLFIKQCLWQCDLLFLLLWLLTFCDTFAQQYGPVENLNSCLTLIGISAGFRIYSNTDGIHCMSCTVRLCHTNLCCGHC